jgi:tetratricopeptide (TPR) repeat protein
LNLAAAYQLNGNNRSAISMYERLLETKPVDFEANYNLGRMLATTSATSEKNKAKTYLEKAQKSNPKDSRTYEQLIKVYRDLKMADKVAEQETALKSLKKI